jgi:hypothetical protein
VRTELNPPNLHEHFCDALVFLPPPHPSLSSGKFVLAHSPVRPLLVPDGVAALQRDLVVAVAAQVVHRALGVFEAAAAGLEARVGGAGGAEVGLAAGGGGLILLAGHGCDCVVVVLWRWS